MPTGQFLVPSPSLQIFSYSASVQVKYQEGEGQNYEDQWRKGDVIGVAVDLRGKTMSVFINGGPSAEKNEVVFQGHELERVQQGVFPAVTLIGKIRVMMHQPLFKLTRIVLH